MLGATEVLTSLTVKIVIYIHAIGDGQVYFIGLSNPGRILSGIYMSECVSVGTMDLVKPLSHKMA